MPWQNITDIILIVSSPAWLRCWARSPVHCPGHRESLSRSAAWTAWPRHDPASPGWGASLLTLTSLHWLVVTGEQSDNLKFKYKVNGNMWRGKCWAHFWTWTWGENYAKHSKVQCDDGREKLHIFAEARSRKGLFTSQQSLFKDYNGECKNFPLKVLSKNVFFWILQSK